jgi:hypothetical protein
MRTHMGLFLILAVASSSVRASDVRVFALKRTGEGVQIETVTISAGQTKVIVCDGTPYIDVVCPPAPGGSGSLAQTHRRRVIALSNVDGSLRAIENPGEGQRELVMLPDAHEYDIRVSVTSADGRQWAFLISGYEHVSADNAGPVIDMFAGRVPLQPGDYVICTDTVRVHHDRKTYGTAPLEYDRYLIVRGRLADGTSGDFIVDLGGGQTLVDRSFLPADAGIHESHMVQYSNAGKELLKYEPGGATGKVTSILGHTTLPALHFGDITFSDASVAVISELPAFGGRKVAGILGIDLLREAEFLSLKYPERGSGSGELRLARERSVPVADSVIELPFSTVNTHSMIKVGVNGTPVSVILDTGAPEPILDGQAARAAGINPTPAGDDASGLDGGAVRIDPATVDLLTVGGHEIRDVDIHVSDLPVFTIMRTHGQCVGLLGNSLFAQFNRLELDFNARRLRLVP